MLVEQFAAAAAEAGRLDIPARRQDRAADRVAAIYRELRTRGVRDVLIPLRESRDLEVRACAAAHVFEFFPESGERVLEAMIAEPFLTGFDSELPISSAWIRWHARPRRDVR